ncbi:PRTRC system protein B [Mucilaginibacter robiniae]|uniref:PRTRC system protein B n=1 Tax=Mucilaginibacter robiniae TaxID=2728022 RepID=A0A7L5DZS1_9SPHI|nr:PRTRC system protein B [Mucilaginibacter robiniae]QJD96271.1 PRTRC system protein B [Mucilaginibacter robiniae]
MKDLTGTFGNLYEPVKALIILRKTGESQQSDYYIESYDMDDKGCPINGHPLSVRESNSLAKALQAGEKKAQGFLTPKDLMPPNVLHLNSGADGYVIWHTPPQPVKLLFTENLGIPSAMAHIPALVWKAGKGSLQLFAVYAAEFEETTPLFYAPFFNIYPDGRVCMGNVRIRIPNDCGLERFMERWQEYFFNSYFSHLIGGHEPIKGNIVQLWQQLTANAEPFPTEVLNPTPYQLKNLLR